MIEDEVCGALPTGGNREGEMGSYFSFNLVSKECESVTLDEYTEGNKFLSLDDCRDTCMVSRGQRLRIQHLTTEICIYIHIFFSFTTGRPTRGARMCKPDPATAELAGRSLSTMQEMTAAPRSPTEDAGGARTCSGRERSVRGPASTVVIVKDRLMYPFLFCPSIKNCDNG